MDNKCTPIGELKNTKIDGSKVYLTNEDGHHYRYLEALYNPWQIMMIVFEVAEVWTQSSQLCMV